MLVTIIFGKTNTAGAHNKKYQSNLLTLKTESYEHYRTKHEPYNNKAPHFITAGLQI